MENKSDWIVVGRFGRPQGLKGFIRVISFTEPQQNIANYSPWYAELNGQWQAIKIVEIEEHNKFILVRIDGYQQREDIANLTNINIAVQRTQLPDLPRGDYYWHELEGMTVVNKEGLCLGQVAEIFATGSNDVLVVSGEKRYLIPYLLDDVIIQIDEKQRQITVDWDMDF